MLRVLHTHVWSHAWPRLERLGEAAGSTSPRHSAVPRDWLMLRAFSVHLQKAAPGTLTPPLRASSAAAVASTGRESASRAGELRVCFNGIRFETTTLEDTCWNSGTLLFIFSLKKLMSELGIVAHAFDPSTWETQSDGFL